MTQDEIIEMAKQAEIKHRTDVFYSEFCDGVYADDLESFAKLVAAKEREECAKVCETHGVHGLLNVWNGGPDWYKHGKDCAEAIRARGNT